mgnify:CR=1 FL=1
MSSLEDFSINEWKQIKADIDNLLQELKNALQYNAQLIIITNAQFLEVFKISERTAQRWREQNIVGFSKIGGNIYYSMQDVMDLYKEHYEEPRRKMNKILNNKK